MVLQQDIKPKFGDLFHYMPKNKPNYIIVCDIETTGLYPTTDLILEIGIVKLDLTSGRLEKLFDHIIKEPNFDEKYVHSWIFENSDLKFDDVLNASLLEEFKSELQNIFEKYPATAYNKQFDFGFLKNRGILINKEEDCPMLQATPILRLPAKYNKPGYKYPSVEEAWRFYFAEKPYREAHRAYDDAVHEAQIVYEMHKNGHWVKRTVK